MCGGNCYKARGPFSNIILFPWSAFRTTKIMPDEITPAPCTVILSFRVLSQCSTYQRREKRMPRLVHFMQVFFSLHN